MTRNDLRSSLPADVAQALEPMIAALELTFDATGDFEVDGRLATIRSFSLAATGRVRRRNDRKVVHASARDGRGRPTRDGYAFDLGNRLGSTLVVSFGHTESTALECRLVVNVYEATTADA